MNNCGKQYWICLATDRFYYYYYYPIFFYFYCNLFCYLLAYLFTYWLFYLLLCINVVNLLSIKKKNSGHARIPSKKAIVQVTKETDILDTHYLRAKRGARSPNFQMLLCMHRKYGTYIDSFVWTSTKNKRNAPNAIWSRAFGPSIR